ncbi:hypothetical protein [Chlorogloea sp. CCALA 695]|uniref:hypothetical protein n=1 Tax=Chlorogloea sp. CCALA 695 TaxID=2107693 RepID=UPI000D082A68|nr:hypothetical protein [Chlorogloea sp. CCALA 695]PSB30472.1 hypothetical protein C7B70_16080 [Chlorogloea sp. CCALA 695]
MNITTRVKTLLSGSIAGLTLVVLAASPTLASTHNQKTTLNQASSTSAKAELVQKLLSQRTAPVNPTTPQMKPMECACCKSMMNSMPGMTNKMPGMMNNMPGMTDSQNNQPK